MDALNVGDVIVVNEGLRNLDNREVTDHFILNDIATVIELLDYAYDTDENLKYQRVCFNTVDDENLDITMFDDDQQWYTITEHASASSTQINWDPTNSMGTNDNVEDTDDIDLQVAELEYDAYLFESQQINANRSDIDRAILLNIL